MREHRDSNPKEQWVQTQEVQEVKTKLQTLIRAMDSDQFKVRDDAMRKLVTIISDLRTKVSPIPPEFSEVIDPSLMPWHGSQTEFVNAQKKIGRSREQAARLWNAQESMQKEEFDATPRILAGNYPVKVLIDDLERSTGVKINIEGIPLQQIVTVEENKNAWGDILQNLCSILQRRMRYDHKANVMHIEPISHSSAKTIIKGPDILYFQGQSSFTHDSVAITRVPAVGSHLMISGNNYAGRHKVNLTDGKQRPIADLYYQLCYYRSLVSTGGDDNGTITVLSAGNRRSVRGSFEQTVMAGSGQIVTANTYFIRGIWRSSIVCTPHQIQEMQLPCAEKINTTIAKIGENRIDLMKNGTRLVPTEIGECPTDDSILFTFETDEKPDRFNLTFYEHTQETTIVLPIPHLPRTLKP